MVFIFANKESGRSHNTLRSDESSLVHGFQISAELATPDQRHTCTAMNYQSIEELYLLSKK